MSQSHPGPLASPWQHYTGLLGLYAFLLFFQLNATVAYVGLALMTLVFAVQHRGWRPLLRRSAVAWLVVVLALYITIHAYGSAREFPQTAQDQRTVLINWLHWLWFIPAAWVVYRQADALDRMLLALAAGVLARILIQADWAEVGYLFAWPRTGFGYSPIVFALLCGMASLGLLLFAPRFLQRVWPGGRAVRWAVFVGWLSSLAIFLEAMFLTQTRSAVLAAAVVFPVALLARYWDWLLGHGLRSVKGLAVLALILLLGGLFVGKNAGPILSRMNAEPEAVANILKGNTQIPATESIGTRVGLWRIGFKAWVERPWLGWGPGSTRMLVEQATPDAFLRSHAHLHNLYLEILVRLGLLGGLLFAALVGLLVEGVRRAYVQGLIRWDYACFLLAGWAFAAIYMLFDFQIFKYVWRNYCVIWAALSYAAWLGTAHLPSKERG